MCFGKPNDLKKKKNHYIQLLVNGETAEWRLHLLVHYSSVTFCNTKPENIDTEHKIVAICWHITCNFFPKKLFKKKNKKKKSILIQEKLKFQVEFWPRKVCPFFFCQEIFVIFTHLSYNGYKWTTSPQTFFIVIWRVSYLPCYHYIRQHSSHVVYNAYHFPW